jgi:hypothetical protein
VEHALTLNALNALNTLDTLDTTEPPHLTTSNANPFRYSVSGIIGMTG